MAGLRRELATPGLKITQPNALLTALSQATLIIDSFMACTQMKKYEPAHVKRVLITYVNIEGSGKHVPMCGLASLFTFASTQYRELEEASDKEPRSGLTGSLRMHV